MTSASTLHLYEEVLLRALRDIEAVQMVVMTAAAMAAVAASTG